MRRDLLRLATPYLLALFAVAVALLARWPLRPVIGADLPYITFFPAVLATAYYGGFGPGLLAAAAGTLAALLFVIDSPESTLVPTTKDAAGLVLFIAGGAATSWLCELLHRAQRRQASAAAQARESEERLRVTLTSIGDAVLVTDAEGRVTFLNTAAEALTGWPASEAVGRPFGEVFNFVNEETRGAAEDPVGRVLRDGMVVGLANHTVLVARDGTERPIEDRAAPVKDRHGVTTGVVLVFRDMTGERAATRRVAESEARFAQFMSHLPGLAWVKDADGRYVFANDAAEQAFGVPREKLLGRTDGEVFPAATAAQFRENDQRALDGGDVKAVESLVHPDGSTRHSIVTKFRIPAPDGRPALVGGMALDVTDLRRAEESRRFLAEAGEVLASSLDSEVTLAAVARLVVPRLADWCSVYLADAGGIRRVAVAHADPAKAEWAREAARRYPPSLDDPHGPGRVIRSGEPVLVPDVSDAMLAAAARDPEHLALVRGAGIRSAMTVPLVARDRNLGAITFAAAESGRRYGPDDLAVAVELGRRAALAVDNARLFRESEDARRRLGVLVEAASRLTRSLDPADVRAAILDLSHRLVAADAYAIWRLDPETKEWAIADSAGLSDKYLREEGRTPAGAAPMPEDPIVAEDVRATARLESRRLAYRAEGVESLLAVPLRIRGQVAGTLVFYYRNRQLFDDVTVRVAVALGDLAGAALGTAELYQHQSELRRRAEEADRAKDEFLALLGHELRNPLAPIRNAVQILELKGHDPAVVARARGMIGRQVSQLTKLVDELLDASRIARGKVRLTPARLDLAALVKTVVADHRSEAEAAGLTVAIATPECPVWVSGDATRLSQVATNLLNNAVKFTPPGGRVTVRVEAADAGARLSVADTGVGIAPEALPTLFQAFRQVDADPARTKGGLGLGLAVVRGLVELHGGRTSAESDGRGCGSTFVVWLPLDESGPMPVAPPAPPPPASPAPCARRIVIVEDREDTAESLRELLQFCSFRDFVTFRQRGSAGVRRGRGFPRVQSRPVEPRQFPSPATPAATPDACPRDWGDAAARPTATRSDGLPGHPRPGPTPTPPSS